jgi:hypothetical protein
LWHFCDALGRNEPWLIGQLTPDREDLGRSNLNSAFLLHQNWL